MYWTTCFVTGTCKKHVTLKWLPFVIRVLKVTYCRAGPRVLIYWAGLGLVLAWAGPCRVWAGPPKSVRASPLVQTSLLQVLQSCGKELNCSERNEFEIAWYCFPLVNISLAAAVVNWPVWLLQSICVFEYSLIMRTSSDWYVKLSANDVLWNLPDICLVSSWWKFGLFCQCIAGDFVMCDPDWEFILIYCLFTNCTVEGTRSCSGHR